MVRLAARDQRKDFQAIGLESPSSVTEKSKVIAYGFGMLLLTEASLL